MNNKIVKNIFMFIIILSLIFSFNSFTNSSQNLDDQIYVTAIGIDKGKNSDFSINFQLSSTSASSSELSTKDSQKNENSESSNKKDNDKYKITTTECNSIDTAINIVSSYLNRNIDLSHCKLLLISEDLAKEGVGTIVNSLINKVEVRADCTFIISQIQNEYEENTTQVKFSDLITKYYEIISNHDSRKRIFRTCKII